MDNRCARRAGIARSFSDFLLRALDGGREPYFRREGFVRLRPPGAAASPS
jgi:hypothetical protein